MNPPLQKLQLGTINQFVYIPHGRETWVQFLYRTPVHAPDVEVRSETFKCPLLEGHYLSSLAVTFGYLLHIQSGVLHVQPKYFSVLRHSLAERDRFSNVSLLYQSPHLNIFGAAEGATLGTWNGVGEVVTGDLVRKSRPKE